MIWFLFVFGFVVDVVVTKAFVLSCSLNRSSSYYYKSEWSSGKARASLLSPQNDFGLRP